MKYKNVTARVLPDAFAIISIQLLQLKVVWNTWQTWDLPFADGLSYFLAAQMGRHSLEGSPIFIRYYMIFHALFEDAAEIYIGHRLGMLFLSWTILYILLRRFCPVLIAWAIAAYAVLLSPNLHGNFVVHGFILIPILLTVLAASLESRSQLGGTILALITMIFLPLARPEFGIILPLAVFVLFVIDSRQGVLQGQSLLKRVGYVGTLLFVLGWSIYFVLETSMGSSRSFVAFSQHFAWGYEDRYPGTVDNTFEQSNIVMSAVFGENVGSIGDALLANPNAVFEHLLWNGRLLVANLPIAIQPTIPVNWAISIFVIVFFISLVYVLGSHTGRDRVRAIFGMFPRVTLVVTCTLVPTLISSLLIRPRPEYMVGFQPFILVSAAVLISAAVSQMWAQRLVWMIPILTIPMVWVYPSPYNYEGGQDVIWTVEVIDSLPQLEQPYGLLGDGALAFCAYAFRENCIAYGTTDLPAYDAYYPEDWILDENIRIIVLSDGFLGRLDEDLYGYYWTLGADPSRFGWQKLAETGVYNVYIPIEFVPPGN